MLKRITKEFGPRFKVGDVHDYPIGTWRKIETDAKKSIKGFTKLDDYAANALIDGSLINPLRPGVNMRPRLGSPAAAERVKVRAAQRAT